MTQAIPDRPDAVLFEALHDCAQESSGSWNNAGTGHAANCELNYKPQRGDGSVDISKALEVNVEFDLSRQLWSFLVRQGAIPDPRGFIHPCPHMSFVWGDEDVSFLRTRFDEMSKHHCYHGMEYTEDRARIAEWAPLIMEGRDGEACGGVPAHPGGNGHRAEDRGCLTFRQMGPRQRQRQRQRRRQRAMLAGGLARRAAHRRPGCGCAHTCPRRPSTRSAFPSTGSSGTVRCSTSASSSPSPS